MFDNIQYRIKNESKCFIGKEFPAIKLITLENEIFENKVTITNFWFTACPPCLEKIPEFNKLHGKFPANKIIFLEPSPDDKETLLNYIKQYGKIKSKIVPKANAFFY